MSEEKKVPFAHGKRFVNSMRSQGLTDCDAIKEFIDNSVDAESSEVNIQTWDENGVNILSQDDGSGMSRDLLRRALAFGESDNDEVSDKIGRFGFGMPSAVIAKTKWADVYSKQKGGKYLHMHLDLDKISEDPNLELPEPDDEQPENNNKIKDKIKGHDSGTIIFLKSCDRVENKKANTIAKKFKEDFGETYRLMIENGLKIKVNGEAVTKVDPLMASKNHFYFNKLVEGAKKGKKEGKDCGDEGFSTQYGEIENIEVEVEKNGKKEKGYIRIKLYFLPMWQTFFAQGATTIAAASRAFKIGYGTEGFYLMRNKRQIGSGETLNGVFKRHPMLTYFRGEIDFDSVLDEEFGIQNNKSRFHLRDSVVTKIKNRVDLLITQIRSKQQEIANEIRSYSGEGNESKGIQIADTTNIPKTKKHKDIINEGLDNAKEIFIQEIENDSSISEDEKERKKEEIKKIFKEEHSFEIVEVTNKQGPIFTWEYLGKTTKILMNRDHPFFEYYWLGSVGDTRTRTLLELLMYTLVKGEQFHREEVDSGSTLTYDELNNHWSQILRRFLNNPRFMELMENVEDEEVYEK
jgi:hypothetical protein